MHRVTCMIVFVACVVLSFGSALAQETKSLRMLIVRDRTLAETLHRQLRQGASFSALAAAYTIGPELRRWGYSGIVRLEDVQPELRSTLRQLGEGQISDIITIKDRFVILKVISPQIEHLYDTAAKASDANQPSQAVQALQQALRLEEDNVQTYLKLALAFGRAKQYEDAINSLEKARQYAPQSTQITMLLAAAYTHAATETGNRSRADQAIQMYQEALAVNKENAPVVHFGLGKLYLLALQQPQAAITHLEAAIEERPPVPNVYRLLVQAYYDTRQYDKAWQRLRLAHGLGYDFPDLLAKLQQVKGTK